MDNDIFIKKCNELTVGIELGLKEKIKQIANSGCLPLEDHNNNSYELPKLAIIAILREIADLYMPQHITAKQKREIKNIGLFV